MKRFTRALHTPKGLKNVPIPKTASKISDIKQFVDAEKPAISTKPSQYIHSIFPQTVSHLQLKQPTKGVWYTVERSRTGKLPVYTDYNNAGGVWTEVRKITGNVGALRNDLKVLLSMNKADIWVKDASKTIVVKGNRSREIKKILSDKF